MCTDFLAAIHLFICAAVDNKETGKMLKTTVLKLATKVGLLFQAGTLTLEVAWIATPLN